MGDLGGCRTCYVLLYARFRAVAPQKRSPPTPVRSARRFRFLAGRFGGMALVQIGIDRRVFISAQRPRFPGILAACVSAPSGSLGECAHNATDAVRA